MSRSVAQERLDERNTERAAARERVALACQELPAAREAHAPFAGQVTAADVLDVATDRLTRAEEIAAPTRQRVNEFRSVIDDHHRMDSTRRMFDQSNDLEGVAQDAGRLCHALDQWKHWASGRNLDNTALAEIAATLHDHDDRPGISQLAAPLMQWARRRGLELQLRTPPTPTRPSIGIEIDF